MQPTGQVLGGRYELTALIATGGMGQVWEARDQVLGRDVAVKVLRSEYTGDPTFLARFRAEAQLAARLVHPNIATLFDYGEVAPAGPREEHLAYLVMELVRGESLSGLLRREGRLSPERTLDVLRQSAAGLAAAHATGVVHRDVKPGNLLLATDGTVKITDFGVAVSGSTVPLTRTGQVIGTPHYLSPEQAQGARATAASDVYALGVVGYECLAGHHAFDAESSVQVALMQIRDTAAPLPGDVPPRVRALIEAAMVKDPAARFRDGAAFGAAIDAVLAGRSLPSTAVAGRPGQADDRTVVLPPAAAQTAMMPPVPAAATAAAPRTMPPLRLPPESESGPAPHREERPARNWRRVLIPLLALLVLAGLVVGGLQLRGDDGDSSATDPTTSASSTAPSSTAPSSAATSAAADTVTIRSSDFEGEPYRQAQAALQGLGLVVTLEAVQTGDAAEGAVLSVDPDGEVESGSTVTLRYATAPPAATPTPTPTPTPQPVPVPVPSVTPDSGSGADEDEPDENEPDENEGGNGNAGGNGNGNGGGNGNGVVGNAGGNGNAGGKGKD